jgi:hypothetical protein
MAISGGELKPGNTDSPDNHGFSWWGKEFDTYYVPGSKPPPVVPISTGKTFLFGLDDFRLPTPNPYTAPEYGWAENPFFRYEFKSCKMTGYVDNTDCVCVQGEELPAATFDEEPHDIAVVKDKRDCNSHADIIAAAFMTYAPYTSPTTGNPPKDDPPAKPIGRGFGITVRF